MKTKDQILREVGDDEFEQARCSKAILEVLLDIRDGTLASMCGPHNLTQGYVQEKNHTYLFCQYCGKTQEL